MKVLTAVLVSAAMSMALLVAPAQAEPYYPTTGGLFNVPRSTYENKTRIERNIYEAIRHARTGSYIKFAIYSFDRVNMADALIAAKRRGVHVQILLNDHQVTHAMRKLRRVLGTKRTRKSFFHICEQSCRSSAGALHSKIYLFSRTGAARDVVMVGSHNLTGNAINNQWNDLYTTYGRPSLYRAMESIFAEMVPDIDKARRYRYITVGKKYQIGVMPFWSPTPTHDPVMSILRKVRCRGATGGSGSNGRTVIRVSMHAWAGPRGKYLAERIRTLYANGCDVRVMYGMASAPVRRALRVVTTRGKVAVRADGFDSDGDDLIDKYSHQKYLLISGHYGKNTAARRVYTGSSNWSNAGVYGDELIFGVTGIRVYTQWLRNFDYIWTYGSRPDGSSKALPEETTARLAPSTDDEPQPGGPAWEAD